MLVIRGQMVGVVAVAIGAGQYEQPPTIGRSVGLFNISP